jgi:hypothetical protein
MHIRFSNSAQYFLYPSEILYGQDVLVWYLSTFLTFFCHLSFSYITATDHESVRKAVIKVKEVSQRLSKKSTGQVVVVLSRL